MQTGDKSRILISDLFVRSSFVRSAKKSEGNSNYRAAAAELPSRQRTPFPSRMLLLGKFDICLTLLFFPVRFNQWDVSEQNYNDSIEKCSTHRGTRHCLTRTSSFNGFIIPQRLFFLPVLIL